MIEKHVTERLDDIKEYFQNIITNLEYYLSKNPPNHISSSKLHEWNDKAEKFVEDICIETTLILINEGNPYANDVLYASHGFKILNEYITTQSSEIRLETNYLIECLAKLVKLFD